MFLSRPMVFGVLFYQDQWTFWILFIKFTYLRQGAVSYLTLSYLILPYLAQWRLSTRSPSTASNGDPAWGSGSEHFLELPIVSIKQLAVLVAKEKNTFHTKITKTILLVSEP